MPPHGPEGKKGRTKMKGLIVSIAAAALLLTTAITGYSLTVGDGAVIYAANCASCHGADDATITDPGIKSATVGQINKAFNHYTSMKYSILRTNVGVIGAGPKGQMTLKQKSAMVANLSLYHGEDLYNAKFANNSSTQTYNCSYCHGPYDNTPLAGTTNYNKIVKSFRQNKLHNNMMTPLKSKYKLSELQLIAKALAVAPIFTNPTGGTSTSINGATLYYEDCMNCHNGPISVVDQNSPDIEAVYNAGSDGATVIQNAINNPANNMNSTTLINLSPAEIQAIATAIQTDQLPDPSIYQSLTCTPCHNPDGSLKSGAL